MSFAEIPNSRATIPDHGRLRGLAVGNPHPQYAPAGHGHDDLAGLAHDHATFTWVAAVLENSWANAGGGGAEAAYCLLGGVTFLKGRVTGGALATTVLTLPAGFRPAEDRRLAIPVYDAGIHYGGLLYVSSAGEVQVYATGPAGTVDEADLDVCFPAEQ
jgi:hypothetical protein